MSNSKLPDKPKDALAAYILELETYYYSWYESASRKNFYFWQTMQIVAVVAGFATAIVAALLDHLQGVGETFLRLLLILLPLLGSFAATLLVQTRALERKVLREQGRQAFQGIIAQAKADFAAATDDTELTTLHHQLIESVQAIEAQQVVEFVKIAPHPPSRTGL